LLAGIFASGPAGAAQRVREGFDLVTPGNDVMLLRTTLQRAVAEIRNAPRSEESSSGY
jgi:4-hydroxy-2-oxoheptanedioate aldolase